VFQRVFQREDRETQRHRGHKEEKKREEKKRAKQPESSFASLRLCTFAFISPEQPGSLREGRS
jgi:hypothetical protein